MITLNPQDFEMTLATLTLIVIMITLNPQDFEIILATLTLIVIMITLNPQDFEMTLATLTHIGAVLVEAGAITVKKSTNKTTAFLSQMFEPFLLGYWVWCTS